MIFKIQPGRMRGRLSIRPALRLTTRSKTMRKITIAVATALVLGAMTIAIPKLRSNVQAKPVASPAAPQLGDNACKNVVFAFQNSLKGNDTYKIQAKKIEFTISGRNGWFGEDVAFDIDKSDKNGKGECLKGKVCSTKGDNLNQADGRKLIKVKLYFWYKGSHDSDNWSDLVHSEFDATPDQLCGKGSKY